MDQRMQHDFINKPFYKSFRKCTECMKRKIFTRIAKCSGCKRYCHRRCVLLENNSCCRPSLVEPTAQVTEQDLETTVVTLSHEDDQDLDTLRPQEDNCSAESVVVVVDGPDNDNKVLCTEGMDSAERRHCEPDGDDLGTGTGQLDEDFVAIDDEMMTDVGQIAEDATPSEDAMTSDDLRNTALVKEDVLIDEALSTKLSDDESSMALVKDEVQADKASSTPSAVRITDDESSAKLANEEQHTKPIRICSALEPEPYRLSCSAEAEMTEDQIGDVCTEKNECCCEGDENNKQGDDGDQKDVPGEKELD